MSVYTRRTVIDTRVQLGTLDNPNHWTFVFIRMYGLKPFKRYIITYLAIFLPVIYGGLQLSQLTDEAFSAFYSSQLENTEITSKELNLPYPLLDNKKR